jgi:hypothetical protein
MYIPNFAYDQIGWGGCCEFGENSPLKRGFGGFKTQFYSNTIIGIPSYSGAEAIT